MNRQLNEVKSMLEMGDYEKAEETLKAYRAEFPDDWDGKLMEGIIAKLRGDEETFRRIHKEAQSVIDNHEKETIQIKNSQLWEKYHLSKKKITIVVIVILLITGTIGGAIMVYNYLNTQLKFISDFFLSIDPPYPGDVPEQRHQPSPNSPEAVKETTK